MGNGPTLLLDLPGLAVQKVQREPDGTRVVHVVTDDETASACPSCGVLDQMTHCKVIT